MTASAPDREDDVAAEQSELRVGQRVEHRHFGIGHITSLYGRGGLDVVAVSFAEPFGAKVLRLAHTHLTVLPDNIHADQPGGNGP